MSNREPKPGRAKISGFYKLPIEERLAQLGERGLLDGDDVQKLRSGQGTLSVDGADRMVENVVGVFGLPLGLGLNFLVNGKEYVVPFAVEEPSIIAAVSAAAKVVYGAGGFHVTSEESLLIGQIQVVDIENAAKAQHAILQNKEEILNLANSLHPKMVARGGGARDVEVIVHPSATERGDMVVVHILVDTCDAMGANLVNTMCEGVAPLIEKITLGKVFLRILSNLTDRSVVRAHCTLPPSVLEGKGYSGEEVRDYVVLANDFARVDPYRAATHNKGIMNGIDSVAIASGNDWRAIEAAAHAYAARGGTYASLTKWYRDSKGNLAGELAVPLKVGTVGGNFLSNPMVPIAHRLMQVESARELAHVMAAVGLAQNFAALRALVTEGIQRGHMTLHARSVVASAGASPDVFEAVVERLIESGEIKLWKAQEIITALTGAHFSRDGDVASMDTSLPSGAGKIILMGEHAAVYGKHVVAAPIPLAVRAKVEDEGISGVELMIPRWGVEQKVTLGAEHQSSLHKSIDLMLDRLGLQRRAMRIVVYPEIPRATGLGGSAAMAVAVLRALSDHFDLGLSNERINALAFECEQIAHGTSSGVDNAMATYGQLMLYKKGDQPFIQPIETLNPMPVVIGLTGVESLTAKMVAKVRRSRDRFPDLFDRIFSELDQLALQSRDAIVAGDLVRLGEMMNVSQGLLNALGVSSRELEDLIAIARQNGAAGAKLTGSGGGGAMIALCPDDPERVAAAMRRAGYQAIVANLGSRV